MTDTFSQRRRKILGIGGIGGLLLTPLSFVLSRRDKTNWPQNMQPIHFDRDTCSRCNMIISDIRFACQLRGGPQNKAFSFDDLGCMIFWLNDKAQDYPWMNDAATQMWVADASNAFSSKTLGWLIPQQAHYLTNKTSPMGYNLVAVATETADTISFDIARQLTLAKGK